MKTIKAKRKGVLRSPAKRQAHAMTAHMQGSVAKPHRNSKAQGRAKNPSMYDW